MLAISRKKRGFTLIELLVVIAIIAILAAILFPVFARAREAARKASCQSNMKELGTALALYYGDFDAMMPSSILYGYSGTWNPNNFIYYAAAKGYLPPPPTVNYGTWTMLFYSYMKNKDIIWCPSDPNRTDLNEPAAERAKPVSYYWKAAVDQAWYGGPAGTGPVCRKEGDFDFPADQIIFFEHNGWHWGDTSKGLRDSVSINCTFLDGHVATKRIKDSGYNSVTTNPAGPYPGTTGGEPAFFNFNFELSVVASPPTGPHWNPQIYGDNLP